jgi:hypothetical protein
LESPAAGVLLSFGLDRHGSHPAGAYMEAKAPGLPTSIVLAIAAVLAIRGEVRDDGDYLGINPNQPLASNVIRERLRRIGPPMSIHEACRTVVMALPRHRQFSWIDAPARAWPQPRVTQRSGLPD